MSEKIEWYKEVLDLEPNSKVFLPLAKLLVEENDDGEAIEILHAGLQRHPEFLEARLLLVELLHKCRKNTECDAQIKILASMFKKYAGFWQAWAACLGTAQKDEDTASLLRLLAAFFLHGPLSFHEVLDRGLATYFACPPNAAGVTREDSASSGALPEAVSGGENVGENAITPPPSAQDETCLTPAHAGAGKNHNNPDYAACPNDDTQTEPASASGHEKKHAEGQPDAGGEVFGNVSEPSCADDAVLLAGDSAATGLMMPEEAAEERQTDEAAIKEAADGDCAAMELDNIGVIEEEALSLKELFESGQDNDPGADKKIADWRNLSDLSVPFAAQEKESAIQDVADDLRNGAPEELNGDPENRNAAPETYSIRTRSMADVLADQEDYKGALAIYNDLLSAANTPEERNELQARATEISQKLEESEALPPENHTDLSAAVNSKSKDRLINMLETLAQRVEARLGG